MIWFACKQCGKRHGRDEHLSGTMVFCECGHGNRVPWSSTVPEPPPQEARPAPPPRPRPPRPRYDEDDRPEPDFPPPPPRRPRERRRVNPAYCLNHDEAPREATCDACRCSFCPACVVAFQGQALCGPCKNFRVGGLSRPARLAPLALVAFILALVVTGVCLLLTLFAFGASMVPEAGLAVGLACCFVALLLAGGELILGWAALWQLDRRPALGGRAMAMTGAAAGLVGAVWAVSVAAFSIAKHMQG